VQAAYERGCKETAGSKLADLDVAEAQRQVEYTLKVYTDYGQRIRELEQALALLEKGVLSGDNSFGKRMVALEAQIGSLQKDRYEYATLTGRVHALERWQHNGEPPSLDGDSAYRQPGQPAPGTNAQGQPGMDPSAYEQPGRR